MNVLTRALFILLLLPGISRSAGTPGSVRKIACVIREANAGGILPPSGQGSFPPALGKLLGEGYDVRRFAFGRTDGASDLAAWDPDIVLIEPGDVDSTVTGGNPGCLSMDSLETVLTGLRALSSNPRILLLIPLPVFPSSRAADSLLVGGTIQRIRSVAFAARCEVVDLHSLFLRNDEAGFGLPYAPPDAADRVAGRLRDLIEIEGVPDIDMARISTGATETSYYGYRCFTFRFEGREARIVTPKRRAKGSPWIWRARFWGHEPQTEIALLERGFHVAYCDVAELFGNDEALGIWDRFYSMLTGAGLSRKTVLEGLSRGGMYIYRWAVRNPSRVACVYADAPVLDMKSWPGGKGKGGGNPEEWQRFKHDFALGSEEEALAFRGNPLDMAPEIAHEGFPMLHVCGLADPVVPIDENTDPFEKKILHSGGRITVIRKPGIGHHPHSLPNPDPIVRFILEAVAGPSAH